MMNACHRRQQARHGIDAHGDTRRVDAGEADRLGIGAHHGDAVTEGRSCQDQFTTNAQRRSTKSGTGMPRNVPLPMKTIGGRKARDHVAAGQAYRESLDQRHRAEGRQDRRNADIGDEHAVDEPDDSAAHSPAARPTCQTTAGAPSLPGR